MLSVCLSVSHCIGYFFLLTFIEFIKVRIPQRSYSRSDQKSGQHHHLTLVRTKVYDRYDILVSDTFVLKCRGHWQNIRFQFRITILFARITVDLRIANTIFERKKKK